MPTPFPSTSPHFIGLVCSLIGVLGLALFLSRKGVKTKLGQRRRWIWFVALPMLLLVGLLGNGVYGSASRIYLYQSSSWEPLPPDQETVRKALDVALSDKFLKHVFETSGEQQLISSADLKERMNMEWVDHEQAWRRYGIQVTPTPMRGASFLVIEYYDVQNLLFHLLGIGKEDSAQRYEFMAGTVYRSFDELLAIQMAEDAKSDNARLFASLKRLRIGVPDFPRWMEARLVQLLDHHKADEEKKVIKQTIDYVRKYLK
jgi:hypothetical protein